MPISCMLILLQFARDLLGSLGEGSDRLAAHFGFVYLQEPTDSEADSFCRDHHSRFAILPGFLIHDILLRYITLVQLASEGITALEYCYLHAVWRTLGPFGR
eukprot:Skav201311  [mRNA]  locus=scaffold1490:91273:93172:+ [translate_table: standard]